MNAYRHGLATDVTWFPSVVEPVREHLGMVVSGFRMVRAGEDRLYRYGTGAASPEQPSLAKGLRTVLGWAIDLAIGFLVIAGLLVLGAALSRSIG